MKVNGAPVTETKRRLKAGDIVLLSMPEPEPAEPKPENIPLDILYEDKDVIVINKPAGLVVHPGNGNWTGTLVNALLFHCADTLSGVGGVKRPGIVHRLDKDTTGIMVVAKNDLSHRALAEAFADHGLTGDLERAYVALVWGAPAKVAGTVDAPLGRSMKDRTRQAVVKENQPDARHAVTHFEVLERFGEQKDGEPHGQPRRMPPRDRPHPPDPRPHGPYRPPADRRPGIWHGLPHQSQQAAGEAAGAG